MHPDVIDNLHDNVFYHGTYWHDVEPLFTEGFQERIVFDDGGIYRRWGSLGYGAYVTCDLATALFFRRSGVILRMRLAPGTRIVACGPRPDGRHIDSLKREFGTAIVRRPPWKVLPRNKHLTLHEAITLVRYHHERWMSSVSRHEGRREHAHWQLMMHMKPILARYGIDGFGHPANDVGIVVFGHDRVVPVGLVTPDQVDAAMLERARAAEGNEAFEEWLRSCRTPEFRALAAQVAARAGMDGRSAAEGRT